VQEISLIIITGITRYKQIVCYDRKGTMNQVEKRKKKKKAKKKKTPSPNEARVKKTGSCNPYKICKIARKYYMI